ncbi:DEAD/DEAH box helicase [Nocardioides zeae]|uniref:DEAD/DEAH box helicase n=1 Tax=Nocardioides imazamoxiresistens TaxID=3231893 RepID=A0ABU3PRU7_9ACTN|nr:DEAD/DEAH box helicase [Nocardioides zeae]MDT9591597.1 DEAD/DEAH box helicase [Nocardioides zeae]
MEREERQRLKSVAEEVTGWAKRAAKLAKERQQIADERRAAVDALMARLMPVSGQRGVAWRTLSLTPGDSDLVTAMARGHQMPTYSPDAARATEEMGGDGFARAMTDAKSVLGARRMFSSKDKKDTGVRAAEWISGFHSWLGATNFASELERLEGWDKKSVPAIGTSALLTDQAGFASFLANGSELMDRHAFDSAASATTAIDRALQREGDFRSAVTNAGSAVRQAEARKLVSEMPVERLKDATNGQVRISALTSAGIKNVQQVLDQGGRILALPGVGETTCNRMVGAARTIWQTTVDEMPVRIDIRNRSSAATDFLKAMRAWDTARSIKSATSDLEAAQALQPIISALNPSVSHVAVVPEGRSVKDLRSAIAAVEHRASLLAGTGGSAAGDPWDDFVSRPADYFAMLSELGFLSDDEEKSQGDLPTEIVDAIRELKFDTTHLKASLRGYQSFGARFAVVQRKVIIGDEMGLGKTVESLAVLTHLRAKGAHHFLVICPAAVVTNWVREVGTKSHLRAHRLHGPGRDGSLTSWIRNGGVAVTTYDSLGWLDGQIPGRAKPACLVFDEAHYIKNPDAQRTRRSLQLIRASDRTILLTGTPLENRIEEFRNLVGYLRPDLMVRATEFAPRQFRKEVAPAYLRRNQEDVLTELPELVEVDEWMPMSAADEQHYRAAVMDGNFMAMRQAALRAGSSSQKMQRLMDIVEEAEDNERRVLVFSHFRGVLDDIASLLPGRVFGPLTGSVPAAKRQQMVDEFSRAGHGAVLVAQIVAGGVGLNIQAASVVVICEPQLKPTTEWQAIARSRRMGQLESVQVHRLLSEEGVDQRVTEILARKSELFAEFARVSETADSAPEAFDISDAEVAREIVAAERERLLA